MVRGFLLILLALSSIACSNPSSGNSSQGQYFGPYIGQVVDIDTGQGIGGVLVVAYWNRTVHHLVQQEYKLIHVYETFTDGNGRYIVPEYPPRWKRLFAKVNKPGLIFFKSGYGSAQGYDAITNPDLYRSVAGQDWKKCVEQNIWKRDHGMEELVQLKQLPSFKDRIALLSDINSSYCEPKCKTLMRLLHEEERNLATHISSTGERP